MMVLMPAEAWEAYESYPTARAFGMALEQALNHLGEPFGLGKSAEKIGEFLP
ncbi:MAG: hypothetical protein NZX77_03640 [Polyangiaceae bacterium]|nr:hypothetical protein [Polyangiaceae bacterium]